MIFPIQNKTKQKPKSQAGRQDPSRDIFDSLGVDFDKVDYDDVKKALEEIAGGVEGGVGGGERGGGGGGGERGPSRVRLFLNEYGGSE